MSLHEYKGLERHSLGRRQKEFLDFGGCALIRNDSEGIATYGLSTLAMSPLAQAHAGTADPWVPYRPLALLYPNYVSVASNLPQILCPGLVDRV